jgi:hypothetical protein
MAYCCDELATFTTVHVFGLAVHAIFDAWGRGNLGFGEEPLGRGGRIGGVRSLLRGRRHVVYLGCRRSCLRRLMYNLDWRWNGWNVCWTRTNLILLVSFSVLDKFVQACFGLWVRCDRGVH